MGSRKVRLELTEAETEALLTMCTSAEAGDLRELMGDGRQVAAALRALKKVRAAHSSTSRATAVQRCPTCGGKLDWSDDRTGTCIDPDCGDET